MGPGAGLNTPHRATTESQGCGYGTVARTVPELTRCRGLVLVLISAIMSAIMAIIVPYVFKAVWPEQPEQARTGQNSSKS